MVQNARKAEAIIVYNGKDISADLAGSIIDLSFTDNAPGQLDDLQISLEDSQRIWQGSWSPTAGDTISASLRVIDWLISGDKRTLPLGTFEVDSATLSGPPDTVQIKALSLPVGVGARREKRSKAWEKFSLRSIARDIATRAKLMLLYEVPDNPVYDRVDQTEQSDMAFLIELCSKEGVALKVSSGKLVLFDERAYEQRKVVATLTRGDYVVMSYSFGWSTTDTAYRACQVSYTPPKAKKGLTVTYTPPGAPKIGPLLKINENVKSQGEALRLARMKLREQNKNYGRASLSLVGDIRMSAGLTINLSGFGRYDDKYIIESAVHTMSGSGYTTSIEIRKVLEW
jgi:phage protein D